MLHLGFFLDFGLHRCEFPCCTRMVPANDFLVLDMLTLPNASKVSNFSQAIRNASGCGILLRYDVFLDGDRNRNGTNQMQVLKKTFNVL